MSRATRTGGSVTWRSKLCHHLLAESLEAVHWGLHEATAVLTTPTPPDLPAQALAGQHGTISV